MKFFCQHKLLGFVDQCVVQMFMIFPITKFKLVYSFESLSLKLIQGNGVAPHDTWHSNALTRILAWVCSIVLRGVGLSYTMVYKLTKSVHTWHLALVCSRISSSCIIKCKHMTLTISMLNNIFACILKYKTIIWSIPMCYTKCHILNNFVLLNTYLCWQVVSYWQLMDVTLWDLHASSLGPLQIVLYVWQEHIAFA